MKITIKKMTIKMTMTKEDDDKNNTTLNELYKKLEEKFGWTKEKPFYKIASQNCRFKI